MRITATTAQLCRDFNFMKCICNSRCVLLLSSGKIFALSMSSGVLKNQPKQKSGRAIELPAPPPPPSPSAGCLIKPNPFRRVKLPLILSPSKNNLPLKEAHQESFLLKYKPRAYHRNFTVFSVQDNTVRLS